MIKNTCLHNTVYTTLAGSVSEKWSKASNHHAHDSAHDTNVARCSRRSGEREPGRNWLNEKRMLNGRGEVVG